YRDVIANARVILQGREESPKKAEKNALLADIRRTWRAGPLEWMEAAVVLDALGEPAYPALLGTGGNDGRLDFTNNFMQRLTELFDCDEPDAPPRPATRPLLASTLFEEPWQGLRRNAIGQFLPGGAGGANSSSGYSGNALVNAWDFVLMLEGAIVFCSGVARDMSTGRLPHAAAPFAVRSSSAGHGGASKDEKNRGEQWFPLWEHPATLEEVRSVIREGRSTIGTETATSSVDFGRSIARLGVARGITAFQRYGYIERNGQANLAVPLGRWRVAAQPHIDLLDEVAPWVEKLRRAAGADHAPASIGRSARACEEAMLAVCRNADPQRWQDLLIALGAAEAAIPDNPRFAVARRLQPLGFRGQGQRPGLSLEWLRAAAADMAELRLALALAGQHGLTSDGELDLSRPVRRHFLPLDDRNRGFATAQESFADPVERVSTADDLTADAIALVRRRLQEAGRSGSPRLPLAPVKGTEASLHDIARLLRGELDDALILALARPLMALCWRPPLRSPLPKAADAPTSELGVYGLFRLVYNPHSIERADGAAPVSVPLDPAPYARLAAGDLMHAAEAAIRRLSAAGLRPHIRIAVGSPPLARRIAMTLAFPIRPGDTTLLAQRITRPTLGDSGEYPETAVSTNEEQEAQI
ncbi:MAG: type I-G CRISPR-associated protein Cas8g1/Csx17, partial [Planctomycetaceae bacterium]